MLEIQAQLAPQFAICQVNQVEVVENIKEWQKIIRLLLCHFQTPKNGAKQ